jgi:hypothetical protein
LWFLSVVIRILYIHRDQQKNPKLSPVEGVPIKGEARQFFSPWGWRWEEDGMEGLIHVPRVGLTAFRRKATPIRSTALPPCSVRLEAMAENREVFRAWTKRVIKKYKDNKKRNKHSDGDTGGTGGASGSDGASSSSAGPATSAIYEAEAEIDLFADDAPSVPIQLMRCYFKLPDGHVDFVLVDQDDTIDNVKGQMQAKYQMVPKSFELVLNGNVLAPTDTIRDIGLISHDLLIVGGGRLRMWA